MRDWKAWFRAAGIRAIRTFCQCMVSLLPARAMITQVDWKVVLGTSALAAITSIGTSLAGLPEEGVIKGGGITHDKETERDVY